MDFGGLVRRMTFCKCVVALAKYGIAGEDVLDAFWALYSRKLELDV